MVSSVRKIFILDDVKSFLKSYREMVPHFNLRAVEFTLMTMDWTELVEHPELKQASLILIDLRLHNKKEINNPSNFYKISGGVDSQINGFDVAQLCFETAPEAVIKILTANPKLAIQTLKSNQVYTKFFDVSDIIQKPLTLRGMASLVDSL